MFHEFLLLCHLKVPHLSVFANLPYSLAKLFVDLVDNALWRFHNRADRNLHHRFAFEPLLIHADISGDQDHIRISDLLRCKFIFNANGTLGFNFDRIT